MLISLGIWQVKRLAWKQDLLNQIESKLGSVAVQLPRSPNKKDDQYLKVFSSGHFLPQEIHVLTSEKFKGPGFKIIAPFITKSGSIILVDRGFVKEQFKDSKKDSISSIIEGNLLWPDEVDYFTPQPNFTKNIWFARDVEKMSVHLKTLPILLVMSSENNSNEIIEPKSISINIPNNHFQYALTWFSLAAIWFFMTIYFFLARLKQVRRE